MNKTKVHSSNLIYLALCLLAVIAFFFVGIFPNLSALKNMDEEIIVLKQKVDTQALLYPVYRKLLEQITQNPPTKLSVPEKKKISHSQLSQINDIFGRLAAASRVTFDNAVPDASNYLEDVGYFTMNVDFSGDYFNLRELLLGICQLPFLESVDTMRIETINREKHASLKIKIEQE
jgi:hypothetical protein